MPHLPSYPVDRDIGSCCRYQPVLLVFKQQNVTIAGPGAIDGAGSTWWHMAKAHQLQYGRPRLLETMFSSHIVLRDIRLLNSPFWTTHIYASSDVEIDSVTVHAPATAPNTDGFDPDSSRNVWIHHCQVHNGDDGIAIKSGLDAAGRAFNRPCENILVEHCSFTYGDGLSIGSEISGGVRNVTFRHNRLQFANNAGYLKTAPARGGYIIDVLYDHNDCTACAELFKVRVNYDHAKKPANVTFTTIANVTYQHATSLVGKAVRR